MSEEFRKETFTLSKKIDGGSFSDTKIGFLEESPSNSSAMRLMSIIALFMSFIFGIITLFIDISDKSLGAWFTILFLFSSFGGKTLQKGIEIFMMFKK